jgi:hypothetical protein
MEIPLPLPLPGKVESFKLTIGGNVDVIRK